ncbi:hypothetical protein MLD38_024955 [Melastoma candidum]|uniref:Uncharacterized protein n=1 Tax=Melastoma candidum TaxID=119954 RepID=A0ACB9NV81_9MYRT|nr:hypothetical protein MLD38_024955 [Melastoma candidum]
MAKGVWIENLVEMNEETMGIYETLVLGQIDDGTFWFKYFYRVHKREQAESLRANLVKRAISAEEEEDLGWDIEDDDELSNRDVLSFMWVSRCPCVDHHSCFVVSMRLWLNNGMSATHFSSAVDI